MTAVEIGIELRASAGDGSLTVYRRGGLFFDNLVVTTSILTFQPVEDWKKSWDAGLFDSEDGILERTFYRAHLRLGG